MAVFPSTPNGQQLVRWSIAPGWRPALTLIGIAGLIFGIVFWWHVIHDDPSEVGARGLEKARARAPESAVSKLIGTISPAFAN